jgi:hypothetical protein
MASPQSGDLQAHHLALVRRMGSIAAKRHLVDVIENATRRPRRRLLIGQL